MKNKSCLCGPSCTCKNCLCGTHAAFLQLVGNETRLAVLMTLQKGPLSVSQLVDKTMTEQTNLSHALKQLEEHGLVTAERKGKQRIYSLATGSVKALVELIDDHARKHCSKDAKPCCCQGGKP